MSSKHQIKRRTLLKTSAASLAFMIGKGTVHSQPSKPNVLMIMSDQQRGDCTGADGNTAIHTPNMDFIANDGVYFTRAYSCTPSCTPARAALLTGMSPWNNGMLGYGQMAEKYPVAMPQVFRDAGYYTTGIGKMHWHPQRNLHGFHQTILDESGRVQSPDFKSDYRCWFSSVAPNFDPDVTGIGFNDYRAKEYQLPEHLHPTAWTGDVAVNFLKTYNRSEPFFLKVSFARPHSPYDPPKRLMDKYKDADIPKRFVGDWAEPYAKVDDPENYTRWKGDLGEDQALHSRQGYYGAVEYIDEQIGRIIETLEERGMLEDTIIIYFSDHGDMLGDHHHWRKTYAYEGSARVPMMIRWPKGMVSAERGMRFDQTVELRDVLPTLADAASIPLSHEMIDGKSMLDLVRGKTEDWRQYLDLEHDQTYAPINHWSGLTDGHYKYIFHAYTGQEMLFDLDADPGETKNVAADEIYSNQIRKWRNRLIHHLEHRGDHFVKNGELAVRTRNVKYSPNYPREEG